MTPGQFVWRELMTPDDSSAWALTMARIREHRGEVCHGPADVPGGRVAQCTDPEGSAFGIFELNGKRGEGSTRCMEERR